jgi:hypothetical protein
VLGLIGRPARYRQPDANPLWGRTSPMGRGRRQVCPVGSSYVAHGSRTSNARDRSAGGRPGRATLRLGGLLSAPAPRRKVHRRGAKCDVGTRSGPERSGPTQLPGRHIPVIRQCHARTMAELADLHITRLGEPRYESPLSAFVQDRRTNEHYVAEDDRVLYHDTVSLWAASGRPGSGRASSRAGHGGSCFSHRGRRRSASSPAAASARDSTTSSEPS